MIGPIARGSSLVVLFWFMLCVSPATVLNADSSVRFGDAPSLNHPEPHSNYRRCFNRWFRFASYCRCRGNISRLTHHCRRSAIHRRDTSRSARVVDARGKWLIPGLIDMHVHLDEVISPEMFTQFGVTSVRDVGSRLVTIQKVARHARKG